MPETVSFTSRVYHSLLLQDTLGGVPKRAAILNGTLTAMLVQGTKIWWLLAVGITLHGLAYLATKRDPEWMTIATRYWKTQRQYKV